VTDVSSDEQLRLQTGSLPHGITFPKLILKYLLANQSQPHSVSQAKGEEKWSLFKTVQNVIVIWHFCPVQLWSQRNITGA